MPLFSSPTFFLDEHLFSRTESVLTSSIPSSGQARKSKNVHIVPGRRRRQRIKEASVSLHVSAIVSDTTYEQGSSVRFAGPYNFTKRSAADIGPLLTGSAEDSKDLLIVIVEGHTPWLEQALSVAFHSFPKRMLDYVGSYQRATYGQAILPMFKENDVNFAMEYVDVPEDNVTLDLEQDFETRWTPLAIWCCWRDGLKTHPEVPIIVIVGRPNFGLPARLSMLYSQENQRRYNRLKARPHWIYTDFFYSFTEWDDVWDTTRAHMKDLRDEIYGQKAAPPILEQTRALHRYMETIINRRECLRTHIASVKAYVLGLRQLRLHDGDQGPLSRNDITTLEQRLGEINRYLEHHQVTSDTTVKSMENLLSLAFNTETVSQGLQVKRLNYLALVFLPLGFVAGIFGITTFTLHPKWYPVFAFPILIGTILLAVFFGSVMTWWHKFWGGSKARDNYSDQEAQNTPGEPPSPGPSRNNSSRRKYPPRVATTIINDELWVEATNRRSDGHYNQIGKSLRGARPVMLQPPIRKASELERARGNRPARNATYVDSSNSAAGISTVKVANRIRVHAAAGQQLTGGEGVTVRVHQARGDSSLPPPPLTNASRVRKHSDLTDDESEVVGPSEDVYKRRGVVGQHVGGSIVVGTETTTRGKPHTAY